MLVDTEGLVLKAKVHVANVIDQEGIELLLEGARKLFPRLCHLWLDAAVTGAKIRAEAGWRRFWGGRWISSNARANLPRKKF